MNNFITTNSHFPVMTAAPTGDVSPARVPREEAFNLVSDIFAKLAEGKLAGSHYLAFGSVAKELLDPVEAKDFGDIDILTIKPMSHAIDDMKTVFNALSIESKDLGEGNFMLTYRGQLVQLQLIDPEYSAKVYPGGFIGLKDAEFDLDRCVQYPKEGPCNAVPCVPQAFMDTYGKAFYYKGNSKHDPDVRKVGPAVSEFRLDF